jgi:ribonucleoside-diphosphate reductase alpha chain
VTRDDVSALSQLELCLLYQKHWCEHKPSITVTVREEEWLDVGAWVYKHFDEISGGLGFSKVKLLFSALSEVLH